VFPEKSTQHALLLHWRQAEREEGEVTLTFLIFKMEIPIMRINASTLA
jgi:hypothetical protein